MQKSIITVFLLLVCAGSARTVSAAEPVFKLSRGLDIPLLAGGAAVLAGGLIADNCTSSPSWNGTKRDTSEVNGFDSMWMQPYSKTLDTTGTVLMLAVSAAPAALCFLPDADWKTICVMYAETLMYSQGLKEGLKSFTERYRPYMYYSDPDSSSVSSGDYIKSWPSGHTTTVFAAAVFTSYVYCSYYPESPYKVPVTAACLLAASGEGALRIMSGNHFLSDVLSGAVLGSACGFLIPFVHKVNTGLKKNTPRGGNEMQVMLYPAGAGVRFSL